MSYLYYTQPSSGDWNRALPIGNGKLGAMIYGESTSEHYQLNEDSVWFGHYRNRNNPDAKSHLQEIREKILEGDIPEAERLCKYALSGTPQSQHTYQTLGDVYFDFCGGLTSSTSYKRRLDLSTAIHSTTSTDASTRTKYCWEAFASTQYNCLVTKFEVNTEHTLNLAASLQRLCFYEKTEHTKDTLYITGKLGGDGMNFCCGMRFLSDGEVQGVGEHLLAKNASSVVVLITALTEFRSENPREGVEAILDRANACAYQEIRSQHIADYQKLYHRTHLSLAYDKKLDELTTEKRLMRLDEKHLDNGLINTYFDYSRYLLISSSQGDSLPANLQGIWNQDVNAPWGSKYTININTEMNYWPATLCNLPECEEPLFELMLRMEPHGRETAQTMYGCRGFVAHHNTDMWGDTAPQDIYIPATYWVMGGAWLCTHIWNHYLYTKDLNFLKKMYPLIRESVEFFMDFLIEVDGKCLTCPSVSPENTFIMKNGTRGSITAGATMDNEILHDLFSQFAKAAVLVGEEDSEFMAKARVYENKIPAIEVGKYGQIKEWQEDYDEAEPGHRHISQLWALHPSHQITPDGDETLCEAARTTLSRRLSHGGGHTGWSRAWIINMYARLWEGEKSYANLLALLKKSTLSNLLDNHPPFQIDGNFGAAAGIAEMLLQSSEERTVLLPALPTEWADGTVSGLCAMYGAEYRISWTQSELDFVTIDAKDDYDAKVVYKNATKKVSLTAGEKITLRRCDWL